VKSRDGLSDREAIPDLIGIESEPVPLDLFRSSSFSGTCLIVAPTFRHCPSRLCEVVRGLVEQSGHGEVSRRRLVVVFHCSILVETDTTRSHVNRPQSSTNLHPLLMRQKRRGASLEDLAGTVCSAVRYLENVDRRGIL